MPGLSTFPPCIDFKKALASQNKTHGLDSLYPWSRAPWTNGRQGNAFNFAFRLGERFAGSSSGIYLLPCLILKPHLRVPRAHIRHGN